MKAKILIAAAAVLALAGCSSAATTASTTASRPAAAPPSSAAPSPAAPSPSPASTARLTRSQARHAYAGIVDPSNQLESEVSQDDTDQVPLAKFHADLRAYLASVRAAGRQLAATRWPARVQPYVTAMVATDLQADIRCAQQLLKVHSYAQADSLSYTSQDCTATQNESNASTIRSLLGLPPPG